ncbi:MAG TPA: tyrosine-type recombinase/integrase [Candidatus Nanoarchaeia archaeon]|nr:tyrosine-type recombinase/integrase [Candidatus Nanoarchaeia archaeon]
MEEQQHTRKKGKVKERKLQEHLTEEEVNKMFSLVESPRDEMILKFLYYTGMRVNEAINIKKKDINFKAKTIRIRAEITKTRMEADQPIPTSLFKFLEEWCNYKQDDEHIIPLTKQRVWQIVKYYAKKAEIKKNVHPHTFRHSYGTIIWDKTGDLGKVQELLRHKSLASTGIYKHMGVENKKKTVNDVFN